MLEAALAGERQFFAATFDHPTRGPIAAQSDYVPWLNPATGAVDGVVIVVTDVTEQRATERALSESEARFRRIANSAPAMMWVTRLDRVRDFVNQAYVDFVGGERRRKRGRSTGGPRSTPTMSTGSSPRASPARRRCSASRSRAATCATTASGAGCAAYRSRGFGPDGELVGFIGVATDITLAKEAELELAPQVEARTARAGAERGAVPRDLRHGARSHGAAGARRHGRRAQPQGSGVARRRTRARRSARRSGTRRRCRPIRSTSR